MCPQWQLSILIAWQYHKFCLFLLNQTIPNQGLKTWIQTRSWPELSRGGATRLSQSHFVSFFFLIIFLFYFILSNTLSASLWKWKICSSLASFKNDISFKNDKDDSPFENDSSLLKNVVLSVSSRKWQLLLHLPGSSLQRAHITISPLPRGKCS